MKWGHEATFITIKGRVKVVCCCGAQSPKLSQQVAEEWFRKHTGLKEKKTKEVNA